MVIDASALLAILLDAPERARMEDAIAADPVRLVSAASALSASLAMIARFGPDGAPKLDRLLAEIGASMVAFDEAQAALARDAFCRFSEGRHSAALDWSACAAYALSVSEAEPLLFAGEGLRRTDVERI